MKSDLKIYQHPQEVWDHAKCVKMADRTARDGLGTPYSFKGYIGSSASRPTAYGTEVYNGGCIREDKWWDGENWPLPKLAAGFEIVVVPSWGWRIRRTT